MKINLFSSIFYCLVFTLFYISNANAQVGINENNANPDASAMLDVSSTDKGLLIPRMNSTNRENINNPATGLMVFDTTTNSFWYYTTSWQEVKGLDAQNLSLKQDSILINNGNGIDVSSLRYLDETGLQYLDSLYTELVDVEQTDINGAPSMTTTAWQSFTPTISGRFTRLDVHGAGSQLTEGNLRIFEGQGTGGTLLYQTTITRIRTNWNTFDLTDGNIYLTAGERYTFAIESTGRVGGNVGPIGTFLLSITDPSVGGADYTGGRTDSGGSRDYVFRTYYATVSSFTQPIIDLNPTATDSVTVNLNQVATVFFADGTRQVTAATDNQTIDTLRLNGNNLEVSLENDGRVVHAVDLSNYLDNTDAQTLSFNNNILSLTNGGSVDLNSYTNTDEQTISLNNDNFTISNGNTIALNSTFLSNNGLTFATNLSDDFVFGTNSLNYNTGSENKFLFNQAIGAFRVGNVTSTAWNTNNQGNFSFAAGRNTEATATNATAFGDNVRAGSYAEFAIGYNNTNYSVSSTTSASSTDRLFVIGNGSSTSSRSDALIVYKSGDMKLNGSLATEGNMQINLSGTSRMVVQENTSGGTVINLPNNNENTFFGEGAGSGNSTGTKNTFIGYHAGFSSDEGVNNTICGYRAGRINAYGNNNTYYGVEAGFDNLGGNDNVFLGYRAGAGNQIGGSNVFVGFEAGGNTQVGSNNVFLGYKAGRNTAGSNRLYIENSGSNSPLIYGEFDNNLVRVNGTLDLSNGSGDDVVLLRFNTERPWQFEQGGAGANNTLFLKSSSSGKNYNIISADRTPIASYRANNGGNNKVGINKIISTNSNTLEVNGSASKSSAGDWLANSDARLKKNIQVLNSQQTLAQLLNLQGVTYEWNDDKTGNERPEGIQYGFTAQNIQAIFPNLVSKDSQGFLQTSYGTYDAMYVEAFRALNEKIEILEKENADLRAQVGDMQKLQEKQAVMEAMLEQIKAQLSH
ncbi:MAG: tail fiber domain-containing protein [Bacteroidota bacterium]